MSSNLGIGVSNLNWVQSRECAFPGHEEERLSTPCLQNAGDFFYSRIHCKMMSQNLDLSKSSPRGQLFNHDVIVRANELHRQHD
jgi:hypothetical protein